MKLSKSLTKVTPLSKFIAMLLFITLPFVGFYFGMKYQQYVNSPFCTSVIEISK